MTQEFSSTVLRGSLDENDAPRLYELEIDENLRAGYISIGGTSYTQPAVSHITCSPNQINTNTYTLPEIILPRGGILATDGVGTLSWIPRRKTFYNRVEVIDHHEHILTGVTTGGRCIFYLTKDGKSTGTALFSAIYRINSNVVFPAIDVSETAYTSTNSMSIDLKTLQVSCIYIAKCTGENSNA